MRNLYRMEHNVTNEVHEGTSAELAAIIGVTPSTICKKALEYGFVAEHWRIKKIGRISSKGKRNMIVDTPPQEVNKTAEQRTCLFCGELIPVGKNNYFCNYKCGDKHRQKEYAELMKEDTKIRSLKEKPRAKPKYSITEISARARAAGMTYGQYVSANGL